MSQRSIRWQLVLGAAMLAAAVLALPLTAQQQEPTQPPEQETPAVQEENLDDLLEDAAADEELDELSRETGIEGPTSSEIDMIEGLLVEGSEVLEQGFDYDPGDRRDPFRSLLQITDSAAERRGPRPEGIPGMLIDDLTVTGIWITDSGPIAQVRSADDPKSVLLRPGDRLYDGDVVRITLSRDAGAEVVFNQILDDPTAPKPFREVIRRLDP